MGFMRNLEKQTHAKEAGRRGRVATCICVYCSVFSNPNRAECEFRGSWAHSMVLWDQQSHVCVGQSPWYIYWEEDP